MVPTMSWFDATTFASFAKTALKEAQRTIDKALDIQDDPGTDVTTTTPVDSDFFDSWGVPVEEKEKSPKQESMLKDVDISASSWGSFTGSFFTNPVIENVPTKLSLAPTEDEPTQTQPQSSAPLATPEQGLTPSEDSSESIKNLSTETETVIKPTELKLREKIEVLDSKDVAVYPSHKNGEELPNDDKVIIRPHRVKKSSSNRNSYASNRLSIISTESQKSSESVEVLTSISCTTSPDADVPSISTSSSIGLHSSSCTDSVEVIDSLASPSSVEVIWENSSSRTTSQEDSSKDIAQNFYEKKLQEPSSYFDTSPDSVEVIPELDDEVSVADSYTSLSESTAATVLEPPFRMYESFTDLSQSSSKFLSGDSTPDFSLKLPQRGSTDWLSDSFCDGSKTQLGYDVSDSSLLTMSVDGNRRMADSLNESISAKSLNPRYSALEEKPKKTSKSDDKLSRYKNRADTSQCSDDSQDVMLDTISINENYLEECSVGSSSYSDTRTLVANDSEGTMESSCEDSKTQTGSETDSKNEEKLQDRSNSSSLYVKHLLEDAIGDVPLTRETSPTLSEKSRSDLVKVGSEQTSGHTSGDELETTTSSDIEIISRYSPNGDSSSTASTRHSPAKLLSHSSKSKLSLVAVDILGKVTHTKIKGHQREPSEVSSGGSEDSHCIETDKYSKKFSELTELLEARESKLVEYSRSNVELQERNQELKKQLEQAKMETALRLSMGSTEALFAEKDQIIAELREEGEKLSKQQFKHTDIIKKLRGQEKINKQHLENVMDELEKVRKVLSSKEEIERNQTDIISKLTNKINRQDKDISNMMSQLEDAVVKAETLRKTLDSNESELSTCKKTLAQREKELNEAKAAIESKTRKELETKLEVVETNSKESQDRLHRQIYDLREQLKMLEGNQSKRENHSREEINNLMRRLQDAEGRNEELAQSVSSATRPLLRQIESLQSAISHQRDTWEKQERHLLDKLEETESHLNSLMQHEKTFKEETLGLRTKVVNLETQLSSCLETIKEQESEIQLLQDKLQLQKTEFDREKCVNTEKQEMLRTQLVEAKREITNLEHELAVEKAALEAEKRKAALLQEQIKDKEHQVLNLSSPRSSPTLSFGRDSVSSAVWPQFSEDVFETSSTSGRANVYDSLRMGASTSLLEGLQSQLKLRDGEVSQLQWELQRRDADRQALSNELSAITSKVEEFQQLQTSYDALLQMYGEKVEEVEELKLDLQDVKEMYKLQIDQLLNRGKPSGSSQS